MNQKRFLKLNQFILILSFLLSFNLQSNAQVEVKLNPPIALFGFFQTGIEFPIRSDFAFETELIFFAIDDENGGKYTGGGLLLHGKYYFNPDYGSDKVYIGILGGGLGGDGELFAALGFEAGYKWIGKRNILFEIGLGVGRATEDFGVLPYGRLMLGYRFPRKEKK